MNPEKTCTKCKRSLPLDSFSRDRSKKDGLRSQCRECQKAADRRYREANVEAERERKRRYLEANLEGERERKRRYSREVLGQVPGRNGSYAPKAVARLADAHEPITLYLLAVSHEGRSFYVYGLSIAFVRRLADYRRQLDSVDIVATAEIDKLTGSRAEWVLKSTTADVRLDLKGLGVDGVGTENLPDTAASVAMWYDALHWAKRAAATADTAEAWLDAQAALLN